MVYIYPAVFTYEKPGYSVNFPDIQGCFTCGDDLEEAMFMAEDALAIMLYEKETDKSFTNRVDPPSDINSIKHNSNEFVSLVKCDTDVYRRFHKNKIIKKTLTIPEWLNDLGVRNGINFSAVLQEALKEKLGF